MSAAIERFDAWDRPWSFAMVVADSLAEDDRRRFSAAWLTVGAARHWRSADLGSCAEVARLAVVRSFPELSAAAVAALVNAAAYAWR